MGERAEAGQIYTLNGDLGAGKTVFAQGMAAGLGITDPVTSPTFTIVQEYAGGRLPLYHFDVYRIEEPEEMEEVGFDDYLYGDGICLIEWAEQVRELLPENIISVTITKNPEKGFSYRKIELEGLSE
ncbi:MAG: tRNA (adenosine(37)-N6)-threonylcarbamoyltransferase complex ATPase subunit type 1 TsaE [Lachnospiraceae bacterium]|nr:tRNA (adenosine(37)-N6)-threonylcarbamoyltransferase complex ATPase subunit type 1 TsaE [Lachnospiraceae bacterium]